MLNCSLVILLPWADLHLVSISLCSNRKSSCNSCNVFQYLILIHIPIAAIWPFDTLV